MEERIWCKEIGTSCIGRGSGSDQEGGASAGGGGKLPDTGFRRQFGSFSCSASDPFPSPSPPHDPPAATEAAAAHSLRQPACSSPDASQISAGATQLQFSHVHVSSPDPAPLPGLKMGTATDDSSVSDIVTSNLSSSGVGSGRRGRGRPPGSGPRQVLAALGGWFALSAGGNFTPHVVTVATGEDVASKILSFSRKGPRAVCILSANGAVSNVALRPPGPCGATLTYEGRFEILSLSGSFTISDIDGIRSRTGGISVSLAGPDGRVIGGGVAGLLLAASPIQVVVGSFLPNIMKEHKRKSTHDPTSCTSLVTDSDTTPTNNQTQPVVSDSGCQRETPSSPAPREGFPEIDEGSGIPISGSAFKVGGWQSLHSARENRWSPDVNISLPGQE